MLRRLNLRYLYTITIVLVFLVIFLFSIIVYTTSMNSSIQYVNTLTLEQFTYASANIHSIVTRLNDISRGSAMLENSLSNENNRVSVLLDTSLCAALQMLKNRLSLNTELFFYIRGDKNVYTPEGCFQYGIYENQLKDRYDLTMSSLYGSLLQFTDSFLTPVYTADHQSMGIACIIPYPSDSTATNAMLVYLLSPDVIKAEFENFIGSLSGDLLVYNSEYTVLYTQYANSAAPMVPAEKLFKLRGVGIIQYRDQSGRYVVLRINNSTDELTCLMVCKESEFYKSLAPQRQKMLLIIIGISLVIFILLALTTLANYRPIKTLLTDITGQPTTGRNENEIEIIKSYYERSLGEVEELSNRISSLTPLITRQFITRLVLGRINTRNEFDYLAQCAGITFSRKWCVSFYIVVPAAGESIDDVMSILSLALIAFNPPRTMTASGELPGENAMCLIVNFDAEDSQKEGEALRYATLLRATLSKTGAALQNIMIGVGRVYTDPMRMDDSFAEASAAAQLAPSGGAVCPYAPHDPQENETRTSLTEISPLSKLLLLEGIHRGERAIAFRAFDEITKQISTASDSFLFFRFYCADILGFLLKEAAHQGLPTEPEYVKSVLTYNSKAEFIARASQLLDTLCREANRRLQQNDEQLKTRVLHYILENYKRFDMSIQLAADELSLRKSQIASILKEDVGQNFVQYISYLRMNEFKRMLVETDMTIQEIVAAIGYSDVSNFLRKFKSIEGITAGQYREIHGRVS